MSLLVSILSCLYSILDFIAFNVGAISIYEALTLALMGLLAIGGVIFCKD